MVRGMAGLRPSGHVRAPAEVSATQRLSITIAMAYDGWMSLKKILVTSGNGRELPVHYRDTLADAGVIEQIFMRADYDISRLKRGPELQNAYASIVKGGRAPLIVDAG